MGEYFKEVEEESIRDNFVICYELLDELVDFGYPQTTDAKILQEYITQVRFQNNVKEAGFGKYFLQFRRVTNSRLPLNLRPL